MIFELQVRPYPESETKLVQYPLQLFIIVVHSQRHVSIETMKIIELYDYFRFMAYFYFYQ